MNIQQLNSLYGPIKFYFISWPVILYELYKKKEARATGKSFLANIPHLCAKSQAQSSAWPKLPALWATWRPGKLTGNELACLAREKALPQRGNLKKELRSCWDLGGKVVSWSYQGWFYLLYDPYLTSHFNKGTIQQNVALVQYIGKLRSKLAAVFHFTFMELILILF